MSLKLTLSDAAEADRPPVPKPPPLPPPLPVTAVPPPLPVVPNAVDAIPVDDAVELGGDVARCPRCRGKLISPESLGWCQKCGYCRTLEDDKARIQLEQPDAQYRRPGPARMDMLYYLARLPNWVWILFIGVVGILLLVFPVSRRLPDDSIERAVWCLVQLGIGVILFWGTQFWTLLMVADRDDKLGAKDIFLSGRLWAVAIGALPLTRWQICLAVWAVTLIVTAFWPIGGLDHMLRYLPRSSTLPV